MNKSQKQGRPRFSKATRTLGVAFSLLVFLVFVAFFTWHALVNHHGRKEWNAMKDLLRAEGIAYDLASLKKPMPPEAENFAALPMIAAQCQFDQIGGKVVYHHPELQARYKKLGMKSPKSFPNWKEDEFGDLAATAAQLLKDLGNDDASLTNQAPARQIAVKLESLRADLAEIDQYATRPEASYPPLKLVESPVENMRKLLPQFGPLMNLHTLQTSRVLAALENAKLDEAIAGLRAMQQIERTAGSQSLVLGMLIQLRLGDQKLSCVWSGLRRQQWRDQDLEEIQTMLFDHRLYDMAYRTFETELVVMQFLGADYVANEPNGAISRLSQGEPERTILLYNKIFPRGTWEHNKAFASKCFLKDFLLPLQNENFFFTNRQGEYDRDAANRAVADLSLHYCHKVRNDLIDKAIEHDLFATACAIERFRRSQQKIPANMDELVPKFLTDLPLDPWHIGDALSFRSEPENAAYKVYSIGPNGMVDATEDQRTLRMPLPSVP